MRWRLHVSCFVWTTLRYSVYNEMKRRKGANAHIYRSWSQRIIGIWIEKWLSLLLWINFKFFKSQSSKLQLRVSLGHIFSEHWWRGSEVSTLSQCITLLSRDLWLCLTPSRCRRLCFLWWLVRYGGSMQSAAGSYLLGGALSRSEASVWTLVF